MCILPLFCGGWFGCDDGTNQARANDFKYTKIDRPGARLACQTRVIGNGIMIELPKGTFVESERDLEQEIGKKAKKTLIHPMTGEVLVEAGKLVMRSALEKMKQASSSFAVAVPAAPAPEITTRNFLKSFFTTLVAFIRPASTTIAVPC